MRPETRAKIDAFTARIAEIYGIADPTKKFTVTPPLAQKLIDRQQETSDFLGRINIVPVVEKDGEVLGLSTPGLIASRTDTSGNGRRVSRDVTEVTEDNGYRCEKTNYDTRIPYAKLDLWARYPDFETRVRDHIVLGQSMDRIRIGFNGVSVAANTNRVTNPLGQDVNKGWLQQLRERASARVLDEGNTPGKVTFGPAAGADFKTIDALVWGSYRELLDPWHVSRTDLVAIVGRGLLDDKYFNLLNKDQPPTEQQAASMMMSSRRLGELPAFYVPFFPEGTIMVTTFNNLSIYEQESGRRRHMKDSPEIDALENFESSNDAFVVEDLGLACLIENIELAGDNAPTPAGP